MRRILSALIPVLALALSSCAGGDTYTVKGTVAESAMPEAGDVTVIFQHKNGSVDEALLENGSFTFSGPVDKEDIIAVALCVDGRAPQNGDLFGTFVPEPGTINVTIDNPVKVQGGKLNKALARYDKQMNTLVETYYHDAQALVAEKGPEAAAPEVEAMQEKLASDFKAMSKKVFDANSDNSVGAYAFKNVMHDLSLEEIDAWLENAADFIKNANFTNNVRNAKLAYQNTDEGQPFADFAGTSPDGAPVRLSDFVGQGKYALVDFWASWCGPCKAEIPNVKQVFEEFGDAVNVVGVAVWDMDNEGSRNVMSEYEMTWPQIFVGEDKTPTEVYGISGIPHIILFAPDGTIVRRNLRGEEISAAVKEALK